jgi:NAD(P)H dehydrogenase (quinone)
MRIMVVLAHPNPSSFSAALMRALVSGLEEAGHEADLADLCAEGFDPVMGAKELETLGDGDPSDDVRSYQERLLAAHGLAFVFPVWWFGPPAILKGFVDRVFQENFAFRFGAGGMPEGLLPARKALVLNTAGTGAVLYKTFGFGKPMAKTFDEWTLKICGIKEIRHVIFHEVVTCAGTIRQGYLHEARNLGREFFG